MRIRAIRAAVALSLAASLAACASRISTSNAAPELKPTLSEQQEYLVGRSMAAQTIHYHPLVDDPALHEYLNLVGLYIARFSMRPTTFRDYTFMAIRDDRPNAYSAPSGFVFVTTGLLGMCQNEDELAGVLAHEISHVARKHPELAALAANEQETKVRQVKTAARVASAGAATGWWLSKLAAGVVSAPQIGVAAGLADLTIQSRVFDGIVRSVTDKAKNGYDQSQELEADADGIELMTSAGYDPHAYVAFLHRLEQRGQSNAGEGWSGTTHPKPSARIAQAEQLIAQKNLHGEIHPDRTERFQRARARVR